MLQAPAVGAGLRLSRLVAGHLDLNHFKVFLARPAFGAGPVHGHLGPWRPGCNAMFGRAGSFVINPATNQAHPASVFHTYAASIGRLKLGHDGTVLACQCLARCPFTRGQAFDRRTGSLKRRRTGKKCAKTVA